MIPPLPYLASAVGSVTLASIGGSATNSIGTSGQIGLIVFDAQAGQRLALQVTSTTFGNATLTLYNPDGSVLTNPAGISTNSFFKIGLLPKAGTYTIVIAPAPGATGASTVNLINVPPDASATIASDGTPVSVTTTVPGQNMSLTFSGTAGQRIGIREVIGSGNIDSCSSHYSIVQPDGISVFFTTGFGCSSSNFTDVLVLPVTGLYTIPIIPGGPTFGTVTFTMQTIPPDASATIVANGSQVTLTTTVPGQNMSLTFSGSAGERISFQDVIGGGIDSCSTHYTIVQPDGQTVFYNGNFGCVNSSFTDVLVLPVTGTYTIPINPGGTTVGAVTFSLFDVPPDASATIAVDAGPATLTTTRPGQNMRLAFAGSARQRISLLTQTASGGAIANAGCAPLTITAPDGSTVVYRSGCFNYTSQFSDLIVLPTGGTYSILADLPGTVTGAVSFALSTVPPDVTGTISANATAVTLTTTQAAQNISLTFTGSAGQRVSLLTRIDPNGPLAKARCNPLTITQPDGVTVLYRNGCFNTASMFSDVLVLPVAGLYTILADPPDAVTDAVVFTLYNDPNAVATITPGGGSIGVAITAPGQNAVLSFAGTQGKRVALLTQLDAGLTASCDSTQVLQPDGTTQLYNANVCSTSDFSGALPKAASVTTAVPTLSTTGIYTIPFNPGGTITGNATFTLYDVPPDVAGSTSIGTAAANYSISTPGQAIRVTFSGTANQSATVRVALAGNPSPSPCYNITTIKPDGTTILRGDQSCSTSYSSGSLTLPASGAYTIVIAPTGTTIGTFSAAVSSP